MAEQIGSSTTDSLLIIIPSRGEVDWDQDIRNLCFAPISSHDHTGNGNGHRIGTNAIVDSAVTELKLANASVSSAKLQAGSVIENTIATSAVTSTKIAPNAINSTHISADALADVDIAADSIGTSELKDNAVATANIADFAVTTNKINTNAVTTQKLGDLAVTSAKIGGQSVTAAKISIDVAGAGLTKNVGAATPDLSVNVDDSTIEINSDSLRLKDGGVTDAKLGSDVVLNSLTNVTTSPATDDKLVYNGSAWVEYKDRILAKEFDAGSQSVSASPNAIVPVRFSTTNLNKNMNGVHSDTTASEFTILETSKWEIQFKAEQLYISAVSYTHLTLPTTMLV